jgi:hypothetical protein
MIAVETIAPVPGLEATPPAAPPETTAPIARVPDDLRHWAMIGSGVLSFHLKGFMNDPEGKIARDYTEARERRLQERFEPVRAQFIEAEGETIARLCSRRDAIVKEVDANRRKADQLDCEAVQAIGDGKDPRKLFSQAAIRRAEAADLEAWAEKVNEQIEGARRTAVNELDRLLQTALNEEQTAAAARFEELKQELLSHVAKLLPAIELEWRLTTLREQEIKGRFGQLPI